MQLRARLTEHSQETERYVAAAMWSQPIEVMCSSCCGEWDGGAIHVSRLTAKLRRSEQRNRLLKNQLSSAKAELVTDPASAIKIRELNYQVLHLKRYTIVAP